MNGRLPQGTLNSLAVGFRGMSLGGTGLYLPAGTTAVNYGNVAGHPLLDFHLNSLNWTIDCWFTWESGTPFYGCLFQTTKGTTAGDRQVAVYLDSSDMYLSVSCTVGARVSSHAQKFTVSPYPQHLAITYQNYGGLEGFSKIATYRNGELVDGPGNADNAGNTRGSVTALKLGGGESLGGQDFAGKIAVWRQWNHCKTSGQIKALYDAQTRWDLYDVRRSLMLPATASAPSTPGRIIFRNRDYV